MTDTPTYTSPRRQAWYAPLTASVRALGAAAEEHRLALHTMEVAAAHLAPERVLPHPGTVGKLSPSVFGGGTQAVLDVAPHESAVFTIGEGYRQMLGRLRADYEASALLFAAGGAWAASSVIAGGRPTQVTFTCNAEGACVPHPLEITGLSGWPRLMDLEQAREDLAGVTDQQLFVDQLAAQHPYLSEQQAEQMHQAQALVARHMGDYAYAVGELNEKALHHVLTRHPDQHAPRDEQPTHHALAPVAPEEATSHVPS